MLFAGRSLHKQERKGTDGRRKPNLGTYYEDKSKKQRAQSVMFERMKIENCEQVIKMTKKVIKYYLIEDPYQSKRLSTNVFLAPSNQHKLD